MGRLSSKRKIVLSFLCAICLICVGAAAFRFTARAADDNGFSLDGEIKESYEIGKYLEFPSGTFVSGGNEYKAFIVLYYPDGSAAAVDKITFEQEGIYTVEYQNRQTGETESYDFIVNKNAVSFSSDNAMIKSEAVYGKDSSQWNTNLTGLSVKLYSGETMKLNRIININDFKAGEGLFKMYVLPQTLGYYEARTLQFRFTDAYDPDNYVDVYASAVQVLDPETETNLWKFNSTWLLAAANGQVPTGIEWKDTTGTSYTLHTANMGGYPSPVSPYGYTNKVNTVGKEFLEIGFDLAEKRVESTSRLNRSTIVVDLDESYMNEAWEGFTTGEVYLSITAREYRDTRVPYQMIFTELGGFDLSTFENIDDEPPEIDIEWGDYGADSVPVALRNTPYPVFGFSAKDSFTEIRSASVKVFYDYYSSRQEVAVTNGYFIPDKTGTYTIEYTASDYFGNEQKALVSVSSVSALDELEIALSADAVTSVSAGSSVEIAVADVTGGSGISDLTITAENNGVFADIRDGVFRADYAGEYRITYYARDYIGNEKTVSYTVEVSDDSKPQIEDVAGLPKYFLEGFEYVLPVPAAVEYGFGQSPLSVVVTVVDGNGTNIALDATHVFKADENGMATVIYSASNKNGQTDLVLSRPVLTVKDQSGYDLSKYFYTDGLFAEAYNDYIALQTGKSAEKADAEFVNALMADGLSLSFSVDSAMNSFRTLNIYISDAENESDCILLSLEKGTSANAKSYLYYNNKKNSVQIDATFFNDSLLSLGYTESSRTMFIGSSSAVIEETVSGAPFNGFTSGKVYVRFELEGISGNSGVNVYRLNQMLSNYKGDSVKPSVVFTEDYESEIVFGNEISVLKAFAVDVIDPCVQVYVTATGPDGEVLTSVGGKKLENVVPDGQDKFLAAQYGNYLLTYTATDEAGKTATYYRSLSVGDTVPPVMEVEGSVPATVGVGENVAAPFVSVSDNYYEADKLIVFRVLELPDNSQVILSETADAFCAIRAGVYKLRYFAMDAIGNYSMLEFVVVAE